MVETSQTNSCKTFSQVPYNELVERVDAGSKGLIELIKIFKEREELTERNYLYTSRVSRTNIFEFEIPECSTERLLGYFKNYHLFMSRMQLQHHKELQISITKVLNDTKASRNHRINERKQAVQTALDEVTKAEDLLDKAKKSFKKCEQDYQFSKDKVSLANEAILEAARLAEEQKKENAGKEGKMSISRVFTSAFESTPEYERDKHRKRMDRKHKDMQSCLGVIQEKKDGLMARLNALDLCLVEANKVFQEVEVERMEMIRTCVKSFCDMERAMLSAQTEYLDTLQGAVNEHSTSADVAVFIERQKKTEFTHCYTSALKLMDLHLERCLINEERAIKEKESRVSISSPNAVDRNSFTAVSSAPTELSSAATEFNATELHIDPSQESKGEKEKGKEAKPTDVRNLEGSHSNDLRTKEEEEEIEVVDADQLASDQIRELLLQLTGSGSSTNINIPSSQERVERSSSLQLSPPSSVVEGQGESPHHTLPSTGAGGPTPGEGLELRCSSVEVELNDSLLELSLIEDSHGLDKEVGNTAERDSTEMTNRNSGEISGPTVELKDTSIGLQEEPSLGQPDQLLSMEPTGPPRTLSDSFSAPSVSTTLGNITTNQDERQGLASNMGPVVPGDGEKKAPGFVPTLKTLESAEESALRRMSECLDLLFADPVQPLEMETNSGTGLDTEKGSEVVEGSEGVAVAESEWRGLLRFRSVRDLFLQVLDERRGRQGLLSRRSFKEMTEAMKVFLSFCGVREGTNSAMRIANMANTFYTIHTTALNSEEIPTLLAKTVSDPETSITKENPLPTTKINNEDTEIEKNNDETEKENLNETEIGVVNRFPSLNETEAEKKNTTVKDTETEKENEGELVLLTKGREKASPSPESSPIMGSGRNDNRKKTTTIGSLSYARRYLQQEEDIRGHPLWRKEGFWEAALLEGTMSQLDLLEPVHWDELEPDQLREAIINVHNIVFGQLGTLAFAMLDLGLSREEVGERIYSMIEEAQLTEDQSHELLLSINPAFLTSPPRKKSTKKKEEPRLSLDKMNKTLFPAIEELKDKEKHEKNEKNDETIQDGIPLNKIIKTTDKIQKPNQDTKLTNENKKVEDIKTSNEKDNKKEINNLMDSSLSVEKNTKSTTETKNETKTESSNSNATSTSTSSFMKFFSSSKSKKGKEDTNKGVKASPSKNSTINQQNSTFSNTTSTVLNEDKKRRSSEPKSNQDVEMLSTS